MTPLRLVLLTLLLSSLSHTLASNFTEVVARNGASGTTLYGYSTDVDGVHAVVGAHGYDAPLANAGAVEFWRLIDDEWTNLGYMNLSPGAQSGAQFGFAAITTYSASLAYAVIGARYHSGQGGAFAYKWAGISWTLTDTLTPTGHTSGDEFGSRVALEGDVCVVGAPGRSSRAGAFFIFQRDGGDSWNEVLAVSSANSGEGLGFQVAISGDYVAVGAYKYSVPAGSSETGRVYIYKRTGGTWGSTPHQIIENPDAGVNAYFSRGLSLDQDLLVVGAWGDGKAYFYEQNSASLQFELKDQRSGADPSFGIRTEVDAADQLAFVTDYSFSSSTGRVFTYSRESDGTWTDTGTLQGSTASSSSNFGRGLAYSNGTLLAGGYTHASDAGGAWFFKYTPPAAPEAGPDTENPLRCGEYDEANSRYFYDDGTGCETTPTTTDACYYSVSELATTHSATLRSDLSELKADGGTDYIYLAFDLADKYYNRQLVFADAAASECEHGDWEQVSATRDVSSLNSCFTTFVYRLPWTDAYNATSPKCGWDRDTSGANVKLTLDFAVQADEDLSTMRNGTTITRESSFSMPVQVEFPVQVTADTTDVQVFAPVRTIAAIIGQAVTIDESTNPDTATLTLRLSTEVQAPFELHGITSESHPGDVTLASTLDGNNDAAIRKDAECTNSALDCGNEWEWTYTTQTTTEPCDFDGAYSVSFTIRCSDENDTDCPIDSATDSVTISFNVDSNDHCPKVIDSIVLSSDLNVFDSPQRVTAADDFLGDGLQDDGQTAINEGDADQWQVAYFTAPTTSTQVALDTTEFNQVWIIRGDASKVVLLDKDNTHGTGAIACTATAYADADDATSCGTEAGLDSTTCQLIVPDVAFPDKCGAFDFAHRPGTSAVAGSSSTPWFEFDINTGASGFNMDDDAIETMTVHAVIDVTYTNAAKRTADSTLETRADFATVTAPLTAGTATSSSTSTSSTSTLFGMNATVLYGAGAFLALAVLAVLVVVSRRRSTPNITKLQSTTELATLA